MGFLHINGKSLRPLRWRSWASLGWLLSHFYNLFRKLVQAVAWAVAADQIVAAQPVEITGVDIGWMHDDVHVLFDGHRLVVADQRPLDQIVALAVAVKPRLHRPAILAHEGVEAVPDILAGRARLEQVERHLARGFAEFELVLHRLRHLGADHAGTSELGVHAAGPVILDQERDLVALLDHAVLQMPVGNFRWTSERHRGAQINAVLAAVALAVMLCDRGHFGVAHAGLHRRERRTHGAVLHQRRAFYQLHFLRALDDLDAVDHVGRVNITGLRQRALDVIEHRIGHLIGADIAYGGVAERLQRLGGEFRIVILGVMRRGITWRGEDALDAAPGLIALRGRFAAAERSLTHDRHLAVARKHH